MEVNNSLEKLHFMTWGFIWRLWTNCPPPPSGTQEGEVTNAQMSRCSQGKRPGGGNLSKSKWNVYYHWKWTSPLKNCTSWLVASSEDSEPTVDPFPPLVEKKTLLPDILIFQRFLKFAIAKRECVLLALCPWHHLTARLGPSEVGEGGRGLPSESDRNVRRLLREKNCTFWVFNIFNHTNHRGIVLWLCVKKYLNLINYEPHPDCKLAFGFNSNFPTSILVSFS